MKYHFKIHRVRKGGFWAECLELSACLTEADTREELEENMAEALRLYILEESDDAYLAPLPDSSIKKARNVVEVQLDPRVAFSLLLRHYRRRQKKSQNEVRMILGYRNLYSYQRLESGANPTIATVARIKEHFPRFPIERIFS